MPLTDRDQPTLFAATMPAPAPQEPATTQTPGGLTDDLDLFAGPGGWDQGIRPLGVRPLGIEWDEAACQTARAAGHHRLQADIAQLDPHAVVDEHLGGRPVRGLIASPPCQGFSAAGKGRGRTDAALLLEAIPHMPDRDVRAELHQRMTDDRSVLVLEPLRWALALAPQWLAWEQVPAVLPIWEACAEVLRSVGYSVATGVLSAEQYGVPQTRKRAVLVARSPMMTANLGPATLPTPTHSRYYNRTPEKLDPGVRKWVSMAEALGWDGPGAIRSNYGTGGDPAARGLRTASQPAAAITSKVNRNRWVGRPGVDRGVDMPEASMLQSFPADYPWQGKLTDQQRQVGDAVPPQLAAGVVAEVAAERGAATEGAA